MLANNLANATTAGFKADREFYSTYLAPEALDGPEGTLPVASPTIDNNYTDFTEGVSTPTGNPLDVSISGSGFFVVDSKGTRTYTRNGNFRLAPNGTMTTASGESVIGSDAKPIRLDPKQEIEIDGEGVIRQGQQPVARLLIVDFGDRTQLKKAGATYFRYSNPAQPPTAVSAHLEQGRLESANFQPAEAAVRLVSVMRQFEMLQRAMSLGMEMNRRAVEEVAKVRE